MTKIRGGLSIAAGTLLLTSCQFGKATSVTIPFTLDHNRMLVDAEMQRSDGTWRKVRLWVDSGNPELLMSQELASDLAGATGERAPAGPSAGPPQFREAQPPAGVRIGRMALDFRGVPSKVLAQPRWLFSTMHIDANLPSNVLKRYQVVFDYPKGRMTLAAPASLSHRGLRVPAAVSSATGIAQVDAVIDGKPASFALDIGASYSFASDGFVADLARRHLDWPHTVGAVGCANIWGWWPGEPEWQIVRVPQILVGGVPLAGVGLVGLPAFFPDSGSVGEWYSKKTAHPVEGFLGPNAFSSFRVEVDYASGAVYLEKGTEANPHDMDLVGLTIRPQPDGGYLVIGVAGGKEPGCVEPGDGLLRIGDLEVKDATMGTVVDALRGTPGEIRAIVVERQGKRLETRCTVRRFL